MERETIWYTLVLEDPIDYFVEQYHESNNTFSGCRTRQIEREDLVRHWVNDRPLIRLVEDKLLEIVEKSWGQPVQLIAG